MCQKFEWHLINSFSLINYSSTLVTLGESGHPANLLRLHLKNAVRLTILQKLVFCNDSNPNILFQEKPSKLKRKIQLM